MNDLDLPCLVFPFHPKITPFFPRLPPASLPNLTVLARLSRQQEHLSLSTTHIYCVVRCIITNPGTDLQYLLPQKCSFTEMQQETIPFHKRMHSKFVLAAVRTE